MCSDWKLWWVVARWITWLHDSALLLEFSSVCDCTVLCGCYEFVVCFRKSIGRTRFIFLSADEIWDLQYGWGIKRQCLHRKSEDSPKPKKSANVKTKGVNPAHFFFFSSKEESVRNLLLQTSQPSFLSVKFETFTAANSLKESKYLSGESVFCTVTMRLPTRLLLQACFWPKNKYTRVYP
jgi:hypothetical protein